MKRNQKGFSLVEVFIVVTVVVLIGAVGRVVYQRQNKPKTLDAVLSRLTIDAKKTYTNAVFEPKMDWSAESSATAFNKVEGYDYAVSGVGKGVQLAFEPSDTSTTTKQFVFFKKTIPPANSLDQIKAFVGDRLVKYGFTTSDNETYQRNNDTCSVLNDRLALYANVMHEADEKTNLLEVRCFGKELLQEAAAQMKPFVDEYLKTGLYEKEIESGLTVGPLTIKSKNGAGVIGSSHAAGYDIAEMVVSTTRLKQIALFYAKGNDWHFITQANDEFGFECGPMKANPDVRKAMYDQVCLSENGQVKLDTNNPAVQ